EVAHEVFLVRAERRDPERTADREVVVPAARRDQRPTTDRHDRDREPQEPGADLAAVPRDRISNIVHSDHPTSVVAAAPRAPLRSAYVINTSTQAFRKSSSLTGRGPNIA